MNAVRVMRVTSEAPVAARKLSRLPFFFGARWFSSA